MQSLLNKYVNACLLLAPVLVVSAHRVVTFLLLVSFFLWLFWARKQQPEMSSHQRWLFFSAAGVFGVAALSLVLAGFSGEGHRELEKYLRLMLCYPMMAITMVAARKAHLFWFGVVIAGVTAGATSVYDVYWLSKLRANGLDTLNPIFFGSYSLLFAFLSFNAFFWLGARGFTYSRWLALLGVLGGTTGLLLSGSRGGAVAVPVYMSVVFLFFLLTRNFRGATAFLLVAIIAIGSFFYAAPSLMRDRLADIVLEYEGYIERGEDRTSIGWRLYMWETSIYAFFDKPLLGHGVGNFQGLPYKSFLRDEYQEELNTSGHAHSEYFQTLATRGIVGMVPLLALLLIPAHLSLRLLRDRNIIYGVSLLGTVAGFSVYALTDVVFMKSTGADTYAMLVSLLVVLGINAGSEAGDEKPLGESTTA